MNADGYPKFTENWTEMPDTEKVKFKLQYFNFAGNATFIDTAKMKNEMNLPEPKRKWSTVAQTNVFWKTSKNVTEFLNLDPSAELPEGIAAQSVKDIYAQTFAKSLFAKDKAQLDSLLDQGLDNMEKVGLERVLKFKTEAWHKNLELLK
ncbi:hypothetical protein SY83_13325 [Paenibacillus swuensis]|uniref:DUF3502 domain-containing protein n=1 Tax=Paenibacillus swuensis TaxID=1178515 RepID=A0A172TJY1_9BACL|nr:hypothetical protein [Paenibacillus swuensis]ANE47083.1 hypothetical protein SY83_13325 [Paenibacillus swuensis]